MEEHRNITYGLWGEELKEWQVIQRLVRAGFHDPRILLDMFAIIEGESGSYTRAWHANVLRHPVDEDDTPPFGGPIVRDELGRMTIKSIDLGFIQRNVELSLHAVISMTPEAMKVFVDSQFNKYPQLAQADTSAEIAYELFLQRHFRPWFAYQPDTPRYKAKKRRGAKAIGNYLLRTQVGKVDEMGQPASTYPQLGFE